MTDTPQSSPAVSEPYPGPRPFTLAEAAIFKGREKESRDVRDLLVSYQVVVLYSKSGAGKSSLVNAAVVPLLSEDAFEVGPVARVSGALPLDADQSKIANFYVFNALSSCLQPPPDSTALFAAELATSLTASPENRRVVVLDQFEELFTTSPERWRDRRAFFLQLQKLCNTQKDLRVLIVIREDHVAELDPYAELLPDGLRIRYRLDSLREDAALDAVKIPLESAGYSFEPDVAENLVSNLKKINIQTDTGVGEFVGEFVEPVHLQVVCRNLWSNLPKERKLVTASDVQKFADVNEALAAFYGEAVDAAAKKTRVRRSQIRTWVEKKLLTKVGTRGLVYMGKSKTGGISNEVVKVLEDQHLVRAEARGGVLWYELTHDRLIRPLRTSNQAWFARRRRWRLAGAALTTAVLLGILSIPTTRYLKRRAELAREQTIAEADEKRQEALSEAYDKLSEGRGYFQEKKWSEALRAYDTALTIFNHEGDRAGQAETYKLIGSVHGEQWQFSEALSAYQRALELHKSLNDLEAQAEDERRVAGALSSAGVNDEAVQHYQEALTLYNQLSNKEKQVTILIDLADSYRWISEYEKSEGCLQKSLDLYNDKELDTHLVPDKAEIEFTRAILYADEGRYDEAVALLEQVVPKFVARRNSIRAAQATVSLGRVFFFKGELPKAMEEYQSALSIFQDLQSSDPFGSKYGETDTFNKIAEWYTEKRGCMDGLKYADRSLLLAEELKNDGMILAAKRVKARAYLCYKALKEARNDAEDSLKASEKAKDRWSQAYNVETLALIAEASGDIEGAIQNGQKAVDVYNSIGSRTALARAASSNLLRWRSRAGHEDAVSRKNSPTD